MVSTMNAFQVSTNKMKEKTNFIWLAIMNYGGSHCDSGQDKGRIK